MSLQQIELHAKYKYRFDLTHGSSTVTVTQGDMIYLAGSVKNLSEDMPVNVPPGLLKVGAEMYMGEDAKPTAATRCEFSKAYFGANESFDFELLINTSHCRVGEGSILIDLLYEGVAWLRSRGSGSLKIPLNIEPAVSFSGIDENAPLEESRFWKQHVPSYNPQSGLGITSPRFQDYLISTQDSHVAARSMLTEYEITLLYALARHHYSGVGAVVDLGPLIGVGTNALARGLTLNPCQSARKRIYSYDLFLYSGMEHFLPITDSGGTGSIFNRFLDVNREYRDMISIMPGDFLGLKWNGSPIEVLFVDLAKSWILNRHVISEFFPHLVPGRSVIIQQDYVHSAEPWVAITMLYLEEYFEFLYFVYGASAVYRLKKAIPESLLKQDLRALPLQTVDALFERGRANATAAVAEVLKCCQATVRIEKGDLAGAAALVATVDPAARDGTDPSQEFAPAIAPNLAAVQRLLRQAGA